MKKIAVTLLLSGIVTFVIVSCNESPAPSGETKPDASSAIKFGGYESEVKYGEHLVIIMGCNDCHTPKKMGPQGPEPDMSLMLSGHPEKMPPPPLDVKEAIAKGLAATQDLTAWVGAWGISYAANLTPDSTGIGGWTQAQFMKALREGKFKGLDGTRTLLPPMPWQDFKYAKDEEINAMYAYLKSIPPVHNIVPQAAIVPPPSK